MGEQNNQIGVSTINTLRIKVLATNKKSKQKKMSRLIRKAEEWAEWHGTWLEPFFK